MANRNYHNGKHGGAGYGKREPVYIPTASEMASSLFVSLEDITANYDRINTAGRMILCRRTNANDYVRISGQYNTDGSLNVTGIEYGMQCSYLTPTAWEAYARHWASQRKQVPAEEGS